MIAHRCSRAAPSGRISALRLRRRPAVGLVVVVAMAGFLATPATCQETTTSASAAPASEARAPTGFTREMLLRDVAAALVSHFGLSGDLQLELVRPWTPSARLATSWRFDVLEYPPAASSSLLLRGRILEDDRAAGELTLVMRAALWRDAWVARQPLAPGAVLEPSSLEVRRVDVLRERDAVPVEQAGSGYVLARQVGAGRVLTWRDLVRRPLVRKGELVEVEAGEGMLLITMKAVAMESGARGDTITLRNPESRKNFSALVVHENRVQVRF